VGVADPPGLHQQEGHVVKTWPSCFSVKKLDNYKWSQI
jgi:hypothetical protein